MDSTRELIVVLSLKASSSVRKRVRERVNKNQCLGQMEDGTECDSPVHQRGLCSHCYTAWRNTRLQLSEKDRVVYDSRLIRRGNLLGPNGASEYRTQSVFKRMAE